ncbi:hypothetical protein OW492_13515 [Psychromonas sp. 14N.309.X.WAT.B.A12]|uniref:hypothetical protein n=1 Tax=Psychromonas sp. 14N.309.X.WAT.B.A12 TaxID=2998322 RepID=UPI0025B2093C|nr:hypothetical protein [Psychromonas sp. 14N.309.X.WAT.B.A12]MDN2664389.1 hypothetical protein [Psychromonas sp. 14N.309.X.WAT.B.A12]
MKIIIVGTSNSVMGNKGFIESLRIDNEVIQLSSGRTPFLCTLKTIMLNQKLIESSDILIIDHYINDINFYVLEKGPDYIKMVKDFYIYLSSLNVNVLNLMFPILGLKSRKAYNFMKKLLNTQTNLIYPYWI